MDLLGLGLGGLLNFRLLRLGLICLGLLLYWLLWEFTLRGRFGGGDLFILNFFRLGYSLFWKDNSWWLDRFDLFDISL